MKRFFIFYIVLSCLPLNLLGQDYSYLIKSTRNVDLNSMNSALQLDYRENVTLKTICPDLNIFGLKTPQELSENELKSLSDNSIIEFIEKDIEVNFREDPNDPLYKDQWALSLAKIDEVWNFTTGGTTDDGQEIVIAVMDDGFDIDHIDLTGAFFENKGEIPNNDVDDDNNGYTDDYVGVNIQSEGDEHPSLNHGTSVVGLIGAKGNNEEGIAGVNWNIKILPISNVNTVGRILEGYNYILEMRRKYNESNGEEGALIVVSSYSAGVDDVFPTSGIYLEWCNLYDLLGQEGILNFGASTNRFVNVDVVGDMPSTCGSEYFIGITGLNRSGELNMETAYGPQSIDLASPSNGVEATKVNDEYGRFNGTSAATPIAAGVAALLFSVPCPNFSELINVDRVQSINIIKDAILSSVTESEEMKDLYVTGGYLNAGRALTKMVDVCGDSVLTIPSPVGALRILSIETTGNSLKIFYISPNDETHFVRWSDPLGRVLYYNEFIPQKFGEKFSYIEIPKEGTGTVYLSLGNKRNTVSKAYFIRE